MKGLCFCIPGAPNGPPEIVIDSRSAGVLQAMASEQPMPSDTSEIDAKFTEIVEELDLPPAQRQQMFEMPLEKKWQLYCSRKKEEADPNSAKWPDYYVERITSVVKASVYRLQDDNQQRECSLEQLVESLKTALRTQPNSFVTRFIELQGLDCILNLLASMDAETRSGPVHYSAIGCIQALMNNSHGRSHVLSHPDSIKIIAQSLYTSIVKTKIAVLEILGAVCLVPGGHKKVLQAMYHYQQYAGERTRFQTLICDLEPRLGANAGGISGSISSSVGYGGSQSGSASPITSPPRSNTWSQMADSLGTREDMALKTAILSFFNAALNYGPGEEHLEFRIHLRYEFLMLGIQPILDKLREMENVTLDRHIDFFEMVRIEDEKDLAQRYGLDHIDSKSASAMFDVLRKKLNYTQSYPHFLSILEHSLLLPLHGPNYKTNTQHWQLLDRIVQQVSLQSKNGHNPDCEPIDLNVNKIVRMLVNENEIKEVQSKIRELQKQNDEVSHQLGKKEKECELRTQEKEEMVDAVSKMKSKLERETNVHTETQRSLDEITQHFHHLKGQLETEKSERERLEILFKSGNIPDDAKVKLSGTQSSSKISAPSAPPPPPPPPPPMGAPPPPPPPPGGPPPVPGGPPPPPGGPKPPGDFRPMGKKKNIPQPQNPLKSFNWAKLPDNKVDETVWRKLDDTKLYSRLDLREIDRMFSAYQRQDAVSPEDGVSLQASLKLPSSKHRELSVIDGRRAQNCTILLSKLKLSNPEIANAILCMDKNNEIPKDMVEQLLKYVPSQEETALLEEHGQKLDEMARADRFFYEMSRIVHYEKRLKALFYKKSFTERINAVKPKVQSIHDASRQLAQSTSITEVLEIVLAFGNYMNKGQRGNAYGFKIASLNKIIDTKSSQDKNITLLHYLVETLGKFFPHLLKIPEELHAVKAASKESMTELENEVTVLRDGLKDVEKELAFHRSRAEGGSANDPRDKFISVVAEFVTVASCKFSDLEDAVKDMKKEYAAVTKLFGEDSAKMQPDEFFSVFDNFIVSFTEARVENETSRRKKADDEKRMKEMEIREKERANRSKSKRGTRGDDQTPEDTGKKPGEFDDLISALRTGEVFGDDMSKLKRNRKRAGNNGVPSHNGAHPDDMIGAGLVMMTASSNSPKPGTPSKKRTGSRDRLLSKD